MTSLASAPRLLLVEDDAELLLTAQEALEDGGYGVTPAASLPHSLRALEEHLFQFVLTDLFREPEQCQPLQSIQPLIEQAAPIPVGVMTAWPVPEEDVAQANLAFVLPKPFDLDDLLGHLDAHLHPAISSMRQHQVVEAFFAALNARNWKRLARVRMPDVRVGSLAAPAVALSDGLLSLQATLERRFSVLPSYTIEEVQVFPRQDGAAARYLARWQGSDGIPHRAAESLHFRFQGERIAQIDGAF